MENKESRGLRAGQIGYENRAGRGRNIIYEVGKPQEVASIKHNSNCFGSEEAVDVEGGITAR